MDEEVPPAFEPENQILPAPPERDDALAGEGGGDRFRRLRPRQARIGDLDALEASSDEPRLEALANRLDLGEFGHDDARPSGEDVQHDGPRLRLDVADAVGACDLGGGALGGGPIGGVDLGERLALLDSVAPLGEAEHADGVVDGIVLARAPGAEAKRRLADADG
jgi:hypothetical protein